MNGPLTLGTAGHIDHGKTALIRALTGVDTDRLPQERARGISIELGYASLSLPSGRRLSVVDAPGHERFVRTMVAGATGIDLYLMTVAADDGVMPQTREHAAVLRALGVDTGTFAVTKCDLADPEPAMLECADLLPEASSIVAVSSRTGQGLDDLRAALDQAAAEVRSRAERASPARLHVDRVFTIRGAGTVVTGTLWSGDIGRGDEMELLPARRRVRVRGVQVHDEAVDRAPAGQRVAVNLTGVGVGEASRGDVLASAASGLAPTYRLDASLSFVESEPEHSERVQIHHLNGRIANDEFGSARGDLCKPADTRDFAEYVEISKVGRQREIQSTGQGARVPQKRQLGWRAPEAGMIRRQRSGESAQIFEITAVAQIQVKGHTRGTTEHEGDAPDDDEVDAGGAQDVK